MRANEFLMEAEGTPSGVPHLTKELLGHIVKQVGAEGAHAIVKSLEWGDGAAKELLHLIVHDLKNNISMAEAVKQRLDPKCWKGKHKEGTKIKGGVRVNNCVPNESIEEAQLLGFKNSKNYMPGDKAYHPMVGKVSVVKLHGDKVLVKDEHGKIYHMAPHTLRPVSEAWSAKYKRSINCSHPKGFSQKAHCAGKKKHNESVEMEMTCPDCGLSEDYLNLVEEFDLIESTVMNLADFHAVDPDLIWEDLKDLSDEELYVFAVTQEPVMEDWQKANRKDHTNGMSKKAVNAYRREHPGSKLKTAVTTKPSKLKRGSKASKRRSSYCSRSAGQKRMHHIDCSKTPDKAICKARRRWHC
jgi:hypothetical protein